MYIDTTSIKMYVLRSLFLKGIDRRAAKKHSPRFPFQHKASSLGAIRCTSQVHAMSGVWVQNVHDLKASEEEASDSSYDLFLAGRYLFILWMVEICHYLRGKHCLSRKKSLSASLRILNLSLLKWILFQNKGNDLSPPQFDPLPFHHGLQWEWSPLSSTTTQGKPWRMEKAY